MATTIQRSAPNVPRSQANRLVGDLFNLTWRFFNKVNGEKQEIPVDGWDFGLEFFEVRDQQMLPLVTNMHAAQGTYANVFTKGGNIAQLQLAVPSIIFLLPNVQYLCRLYRQTVSFRQSLHIVDVQIDNWPTEVYDTGPWLPEYFDLVFDGDKVSIENTVPGNLDEARLVAAEAAITALYQEKAGIVTGNVYTGVNTFDTLEASHLGGNGGVPFAVAGAGLGANPIVSLNPGSSDLGGNITLGTSVATASLPNDKDLAIISFAQPFPEAPFVSLIPDSLTAKGVYDFVRISSVSPTGFIIHCDTKLSGPSSYQFNYIVIAKTT